MAKRQPETFLVNAYGERWGIAEFAAAGWDSDCAGWEHTRVRRIAMEAIIPFTKGVGVDVGSQKCPVTNTAWRIDHDPRFAEHQNITAKFATADLGIRNLDYVTASHVIEDHANPATILRKWAGWLRPGGHLCLLMPTCDRYPKPGQPGANPAHKYETYPETYRTWEKETKDVLRLVQWDSLSVLRGVYPAMFDTDAVYVKVA